MRLYLVHLRLSFARENGLYAAIAVWQVAATRDVVMNSSDIEQLTDELIGVAVLSLLKDNSPISTRALVTRLRSMEANEPDTQRRKLLGQVIAEISNNNLASLRREAGSKRNEWDEEGGDNVYQLFGKQRPDNTQKH